MNSIYRTQNNDYIDLAEIVAIHSEIDLYPNDSASSHLLLPVTCKYNKSVNLFVYEGYKNHRLNNGQFGLEVNNPEIREELLKAWIRYKEGLYVSNAEIKIEEF